MVVALGSEDSNKSYSLLGNSCEERGLVEVVIQQLSASGAETSVSCYEVVNEQVIDLV